MNELLPIAYEGNEPYIFISYSHKNREKVMEIISGLQNVGCRVWYDDGISPGTEWSENIAQHILNCYYFFSFISKDYITSNHCKEELDFSKGKEKKQLFLFLEEIELTPAMQMRFNQIQHIQYFRYHHLDSFIQKVLKAIDIDKCLDSSINFATSYRGYKTVWEGYDGGQLDIKKGLIGDRPTIVKGLSNGRAKVLIDIGSSGAKCALSYNGREILYKGKFPLQSREDLVEHIHQTGKDWEVDGIALSVPGFVQSSSGQVIFSQATPFLEGDLVAYLKGKFPFATIVLINDGEAHARALLRKQVEFGAISVGFGTSVSFGVINSQRQVLSACDGKNWDIGDFLVETRASHPEIYWSLGQFGLKELEQDMGDTAYERFGYRVGHLLSQLSCIFRPKTIALSGGIMEQHYPKMKDAIESALYHRKIPLLDPKLIFQGEHAALHGLLTLF